MQHKPKIFVISLLCCLFGYSAAAILCILILERNKKEDGKRYRLIDLLSKNAVTWYTGPRRWFFYRLSPHDIIVETFRMNHLSLHSYMHFPFISSFKEELNPRFIFILSVCYPSQWKSKQTFSISFPKKT